MTRIDCANAETLAGAIALEEATDGERESYRRHLASCARCVEAFGGEREIARVMSVVAQARDEESWEPDLRAALRDRTRMRRSAWGLGFGVAAAALAVSLVVNLFAAGALRPVTLVAQSGAPAADNAFHVTLEKRARPEAAPVRRAPAPPASPAPLVVTHNVVALAPPAGPKPAKHASVAAANEPIPTHDPAILSAVPPSEHLKTSIASMQTQSAAPSYSHQAESIAIAPVRATVIREASPFGGSFTLPNPPLIAASEMAAEGLSEATTVFEVAVDDRGIATSCSIERPSGIAAIDESVCRAALHTRFLPRTVNGRPTPGTYRDAFVFLANEHGVP